MKSIQSRGVAGLVLPLLFTFACSSSDPSGTGTVDAGSAPVDSGTSTAQDAHVAPVTDSAADTSSPSGDASVDAGALDATTSEPTCGDPPARYTLLTGTDAGLARDNVTKLVWQRESHGAGEPPQTQAMAKTYCVGLKMRLPTKDEATALATAYASCAFGHWGTWTSTAAPADGYAWVIDYTGGASPQVADNFPSAVLCVRDP